MVNNTHAFLLARTPISTIAFSGAVTNQSMFLNGPGGRSGDGFPLPRRGYLTGLHVWDGTTIRSDFAEIAFDPRDRISVYCQSGGSDFTIGIRVNGINNGLQVSGVPFNSALFATVEFMLVRE
jgi:hypothetical protein